MARRVAVRVLLIPSLCWIAMAWGCDWDRRAMVFCACWCIAPAVVQWSRVKRGLGANAWRAT